MANRDGENNRDFSYDYHQQRRRQRQHDHIWQGDRGENAITEIYFSLYDINYGSRGKRGVDQVMNLIRKTERIISQCKYPSRMTQSGAHIAITSRIPAGVSELERFNFKEDTLQRIKAVIAEEDSKSYDLL